MKEPPRVPLVDLPAEYRAIRAEVRAAIDRVCERQRFILGPEVERLEGELAAYCGARYAAGVSSGSDALLLALLAAGVGPGDEVITSAYSFFASAGAAVRAGARPVFVDITEPGFNLDVDAALARVTPRTRAIIPVHLFGRCADASRLAGGEGGLRVIEDAAQAVGAVDRGGRPAGGTGSAGCLSFFPSKNLGGFGDGGMVLTSDAGLAEEVRLLRVHGAGSRYRHLRVGGNFRLDALQAAVLRVKLRHLPARTRQRRQNAARYRRLFREAGLDGHVALPPDEPGHVYNQFVIRTPRRDALRAHLTRRGVETAVYYPLPLHLQPCLAGLGYRRGSFPRAEAAARTVLALPVHPALSAAQQEIVVAAVGEFFRP